MGVRLTLMGGNPVGLRSRVVTSLGVGIACVALLPGSSQASNFSGETGAFAGCYNNMADNRDHFFYYEALTSATSTAVNWSRTNNYNPTDLNTFTDAVRTSGTDVVAFDADYEGESCGKTWMVNASTPGVIGLTLCQSLSSLRCQQFFVYFDNDWMGPASAAQENSLACHELGHSVGLLHGSAGCMVATNNASTSLTDHDRSHINTYY